MKGKNNRKTKTCPVTVTAVTAKARQRFEELLGFCQTSPCTFWEFKKQLLVVMAVLGRLLVR